MASNTYYIYYVTLETVKPFGLLLVIVKGLYK